MSQADVIKVLEKNKDKKLTAEEIAQIIQVNSAAIRTSLNKLLKSHEVKRMELSKKEFKELEKNKHFAGRYYVWKLN